MLASAVPAKPPIPFADSGAKNTIPTASQIGVTPGAASLTDGFPPLTRTPLAAGGVPPFGQDMNGILNLTTAWDRWQAAGGPVRYDSAFATAIGGYPAGAVLAATTVGGRWLNLVDGNTTDPDAGGANWRSLSTGRLLNIQVFTASGTYTPTPGMVSCIVECQGGGGAGGGSGGASAGNVSLGAPGAAGSYAKGIFSAAQIGASKVVTVGAGGAGASASAGGTGGTSSLGSLISAPGGTGGGVLTNQAPPTVNGNGVYSSAPAGGNIFQVAGAAGAACVALSADAAFNGAGGASIFGPGAPTGSMNVNGVAAVNYGAGGNGSVVNASGGNATGGAGKAGLVIVTEFS